MPAVETPEVERLSVSRVALVILTLSPLSDTYRISVSQNRLWSIKGAAVESASRIAAWRGSMNRLLLIWVRAPEAQILGDGLR